MIQNLLDPDGLDTWQSEAYYLAARHRVVGVMGNAELRIIEINAGGQLLPHVQPRQTWYCCIQGAGIFTDQDQEQEFQWGDMVDLAPRRIRAFAATGETPLYVLFAMAVTDSLLSPPDWRDLLGKFAGRFK